MEQLKHLKWAVAYKISGDNFDNKKERISITAVFNYPHLAEEFIVKCLPEFSRDRFFVVNIEELES